MKDIFFKKRQYFHIMMGCFEGLYHGEDLQRPEAEHHPDSARRS